MAEESLMVGAIQFMDKIGIYDVVLPFLLVFVIVYAILDKTMVFGTETIDGNQVPRKNLNAMAAFVIGFLVVASTNLVASINTFVANMVLLLVLSFTFLLLVGSFTKPEDLEKSKGVFLDGAMKYVFMGIMFIGIVIIFLDAMTVSNSKFCNGTCTWLEIGFSYISGGVDSSALASLLFLVVIGGIIFWLTWEQRGGQGNSEK